MEKNIQNLEKEIESLEEELEIQKKDRTKSRVKDVGFGLLAPLAAATGIYFVGRLISSTPDNVWLEKIADFVNNNLPLIHISAKGLKIAGGLAIYGAATGPLLKYCEGKAKKFKEEIDHYSKKIKYLKEQIHRADIDIQDEGFRIKREKEGELSIEEGVKRYSMTLAQGAVPLEEITWKDRKKIRRLEPVYDQTEQDYSARISPEGEILQEYPEIQSEKIRVESESDRASFENNNAYAMLARAVDSMDSRLNPHAKTLSSEERLIIPGWKDSFFRFAKNSEDSYGVVTEDGAGDALRKVLLSRGMLDF